MTAMAAAVTDTTAVIGGEVAPPRRRGKSKAPNFKYDGPVSVIRLEIGLTDGAHPAPVGTPVGGGVSAAPGTAARRGRTVPGVLGGRS